MDVSLVEPLGAENVVHLELGDVDLCARVPSLIPGRSGQRLAVAFEPAAFRFFDTATGATLRTSLRSGDPAP